MVPSLIPKRKLERAIVMNSIQFNMARLCGPMLAAAIIAVDGDAGAAFTLNACTFIPLLFVPCCFIQNISKSMRSETTSLWADIHEGLRFVWKNQGTRRLTIMGLIFVFLSAPLQGLLPVFAQKCALWWGRPFGVHAFSNRTGVDSECISALLHSLP